MTENNRLIPIIDEFGNLNGTLLMINSNFDVNSNFDINEKRLQNIISVKNRA